MNARVYLPRSTDETITFAGAELSRYLAKATGRPCPVVAGAPPPSTRDRELVVTVRAAGSDGEGFTIRADGGRIDIEGESPTGALFGVYQFLEKSVGYSFLLPGTDLPPTDAPGSLSRLQRQRFVVRERPSFALRERTFLNSQDFLSRDTFNLHMLPAYIDWMAKNRMNLAYLFFVDPRTPYWREVRKHFPAMRRRGLKIGVGDPLYRFLVSEKSLRSRHPAWFRHVPTERAHDWVNPEISQANFCGSERGAVRHLIRGLERLLAELPPVDFLSVRSNDGGSWCECRRCGRLSVSDRYMQIQLAVAEAVARVDSRITLVHQPYGALVAPPTRFRPAPNMIVLFEPWGRDFRYPFNHRSCPVHQSRDNMMRASCVDYQVYLDRWLEVCAKAGVDLYIHEKYGRQLLLGGHLLPPPCLEEDMRFFHRRGVKGLQLHVGMGGSWTSAMTMHAASRLLWNAKSSVRDEVREVMRRYYGPAAPAVSRVLARYEDAVESWQYANRNTNLNLWTSVGPTEDYPPALHAFNDRLLAVLDESLEALRAARARHRGAPWGEHLGELMHALGYINSQRRAVAEGIRVQSALAALGPGLAPAQHVARLTEALDHARSVQRLTAATRRHARLGYRRGLCWDVVKPSAAEAIGGVRYAW